jgi:predicted HAD superfamily Cof-like phosphohydrolase
MNAHVLPPVAGSALPFKAASFARFTTDVRNFHEVCGLPIGSTRDALTQDRIELRDRLLVEEWTETKAALADKNVVEVADGLVDVIYIAAGTAVECGVVLSPQYPFIFGAEFDHYFDAVRTSLFERTSEVRVAPTGGLVEIMESCVKIANRVVTENDRDRIQPALSNVVEVALLIGAICGIPVFEAWKEIHRSNMAKVDPVTGRVLKREDGKVLKPEGWTRPNVAGVIELYLKNIQHTDMLNEAAKALDASYVEVRKVAPYVKGVSPEVVSKRIEVAIRCYVDVMALTVFCYEEAVSDPNRLEDLLAAMDETVDRMKFAEAAASAAYENGANSYSYSLMSASIASLVKLRAMQSVMQRG